MKALRFDAPGHAVVIEKAIPEIGHDEVLVAARSVGVCHSDIELLEGRYILPFTYPVIPGHEWSGVVEKVGRDVMGFSPGDAVVGEVVIRDDEHFGFTTDGAAAEFFVTRPEWLHKLPPQIGFDNGALVEPFTVAYHALLTAGNVNSSDVVVVLGGGPVGLATVACASHLGAVVIASDPHETRRAAAARLGAVRSVHPDDLDAAIDSVAGRRGADVVIEATGRPSAMSRALEIAAFRGRITFVGIDVGREAPARLGLIQSKELAIHGTIGSPGAWPAALRFMATRRIDLTPLVTSTFTIDEAVHAVEEARHPSEGTIKAHIRFGATEA